METVPLQEKRRRERLSFRIAVIYAVVGAGWIFFSDKIALLFTRTPEALTEIAIIKGCFYVLLTAFLLYHLVSRGMKELESSREALLRAKEDWERTFDAVPDLIAILDKDYRIARANKAMAAKLGVTPEACAGLRCYEAVHGASEPPWFCPHRQMLTDGVEHTTEVHEDGLGGDFVVSVSPLFDPTGKLIRSVHVARDITDRKRTEEALRESEEKYRKIFENANEAIFVAQDGRLVFLNPMTAMMIGYSAEELVSRPFIEFIHPDDRDMVVDRHVRRLKGEKIPYHYSFRIVHKDGNIRWAELNAVLINLKGKAATLNFLSDITERKQSDEAVSESRNFLAKILDTIADPVLVKDRRHCWILLNDAYCRFMGYRREELMGKSDYDFFPAGEADVFWQKDEEVFTTGIENENEEQFTDAKGVTHTIITKKSRYLNASGEPVLVGVIRDITERKQAEEERRTLEERLQRAEKMESLGTMAGGVAHDLNNVLGIVVGYSELLLGDLDESSAARSEAMEILKGGQRAAAIVQDLLTLARRGVPSRQVLNLNSIIMDCQKSPEFAKIFSYHSKVRTKSDFEADLLNISGSSVHLGKSFLNLVSNAAEAMINGGTLTIRTRNQYLDKPVSGYDEVKEGDYVVLSISDTGEGIPAANLKRIFEPFYTKKVMGRSGTGLGLAVVWGTVKDHFGYINVESEEGKGTTFTLYFPVMRAEISPAQISVAASEYMGHGESILVVDDVKEQRDLATAMLAKLNYEVTSVPSGEDAVGYLRNSQVDLIVLDMIMEPGMDGLDTYLKILEIHPHQKAIIVSGFSETERLTKAQESGAGDYVKKPYVVEKLGLAVKKELERSA